MNESNRIESNRIESNLRPGQFSTCTRRGSNKLLPGVPHHRTQTCRPNRQKCERGTTGGAVRVCDTDAPSRAPAGQAMLPLCHHNALVNWRLASVDPTTQKYRSICLGPSTAVNSWREGRHRRNGTSLGCRRTLPTPRQSQDRLHEYTCIKISPTHF